MPLHIAFDARHLRDFGVGTYIRNLLQALSHLDRENQYTLIVPKADAALFSNLGPNYRLVHYEGWLQPVAGPD